MADKRISQLIERVDIANNDVLPIVASGATTTNKVTVSTLQDWMQDNLDVGVTSVGLSMPSAFVVSNSPVTGSGNISVTGAGTASQYVRGDGSLADFPSGGGGGGSSVNYYLNGSVSQGTIGGIAYQEMNKVPVLGTGTDFTIAADGYIASFITDAGDPALLQIPAGNWNFETYLQASSGGGTPTFYIELYKVDSGGTATLIASNSGSPELIAFGTTTTPYFSALAVPETILTLTDRLALRYYVNHSGRTITLHTENATLCQIITTFTTGVTALNGLTAQVQNFATGTSGTNFGISSTGSTHTFNLPTASATNRGALSSADWSSFNGKVPYTGAVANVDLGSYSITANAINSAGSGSTAGQINLRSDAFFSLVNGYGSIASGTTNQFNLYQTTGAGVFRGAILSLNSITASATRTYTLPDLDGTLALTSQIPTNPVGGTGAQGRVAYWNGAGTITSDSLFQWNDTFKRLGIGRTPTVSLDVEGAGFFSTSVTSQVSNISADGAGVVLQGYVDNTLRIAVRGSGYNSGARGGLIAGTGDFSGALNGTSASFTGGVNAGVTSGRSYYANHTSAYSFLFSQINAANTIAFDNNAGDLQIYTGNSLRLTLASTGAATFSSSVTTLGSVDITGEGNTLTLRKSTNVPALTFIGASSNTIIEGGNTFNLYTGGAGNRIFVTSTGNVGIGTPSPGARFEVKQGGSEIPMIIDSSSDSFGAYTQYQVNNSGGWEVGMARAADSYSYLFSYGSFGTANAKVTITNGGNVTIVGSLSKGSGSFKIDHPLPEKKDTHNLVHSFIEGPQADNIYRGKIDLVDGFAEVNIDEVSGMSEGTFVLLNGNIQCFTSNEKGWTPIRGKVEGNILKIEAQDSKCTDTISWLVIGERIDQHMIDTDWTDENGKVIVEPIKEKENIVLNEDLPNENQMQ